MNSSIEYSRDYQNIMLTAYNRLKSAYKTHCQASEESKESSSSLNSYDFAQLKMLQYNILSLLSGLSGVSVPIPCYVSPDDERFTEINPILTYTHLRHALQQNHNIGGLFIRDLFTKSKHCSITANGEVIAFAKSLNYEWFLQRYTYNVEFVNTIPDVLSSKTLYVITQNKMIVCAALTAANEKVEEIFKTDNTFNGKRLPSCRNKFEMRDFVNSNAMYILAMLFYGNRSEGCFDAFKEGFSIPGFNEHLINIARLWNKGLIANANLADVKLTYTHLCSSVGSSYFGADFIPSSTSCNSTELNKYITEASTIIKEVKSNIKLLESSVTQQTRDREDEESDDDEIAEAFATARL